MMESWKKPVSTILPGKKAKKNHRTKKYKAMKFNGDDKYSWAVFYQEDVAGFRTPIFEDMGIKPILA